MTKQKIMLLSGPIAAGKSTVTREVMSRTPSTLLKTHKLIQKLGAARGITVKRERMALEKMAMTLEAESKGSWIVAPLRQELKALLANGKAGGLVIVDAVRSPEQVAAIRKNFPDHEIYHLHITAEDTVLKARYENRLAGKTNEVDEPDYTEAKSNFFESQKVPFLAKMADITARTDIEDTLKSAARIVKHCKLAPKTKNKKPATSFKI